MARSAGHPVFAGDADTQLRELDDETLVYRRAERRVVVLNRTAGAILRLCDGRRAENEIASCLAEQYPTQSVANLLRDVQGTLEELERLGLVSRT